MRCTLNSVRCSFCRSIRNNANHPNYLRDSSWLMFWANAVNISGACWKTTQSSPFHACVLIYANKNFRPKFIIMYSMIAASSIWSGSQVPMAILFNIFRTRSFCWRLKCRRTHSATLPFTALMHVHIRTSNALLQSTCASSTIWLYLYQTTFTRAHLLVLVAISSNSLWE